MLLPILLVISLVGLVAAVQVERSVRARWTVLATRLRAEDQRAWIDGDAEAGLRVLDALAAGRAYVEASDSKRAYLLRELHRTDEAVDVVLAMRAEGARGALGWIDYNTMVDTLVCAGRYRDALAVEASMPTTLREDAHRRREPEWGLVQINLAEADANVGAIDRALARLDGWDAHVAGHPLIATGLRMQRGWLLGALGRGDEALAALQGGQRDDLGKSYASEYHLSHAFACLGAGRLDEAEAQIAEARAIAVRPSTIRNTLFLRARVAFERGDFDEAERLCREGAEHPWRWQGGDGLLLLAELCARRGDVEGRERALRLVIERDPESTCAAEARAKLREAGHAIADEGFPPRDVPPRKPPRRPRWPKLDLRRQYWLAVGAILFFTIAACASVFVLAVTS